MIHPIRSSTVFGLLLLSAVGLQGCVAIVWLGAVGIDTTRTSDIEFHPFEHSLVLAPHERERLASVHSLAVMPFLGDTVMAERWATVLRQLTDLRVVGPSGVPRQRHPQAQLSASHEFHNGLPASGQIGLAQRISAESRVDCVLFGRVAAQKPEQSFAGLKESSSRRLYMRLVSAEGTLIWKTELPFTMVKGAKDLDEAMVTHALLTHVRAHVNEALLAELGANH